VPGSGVYTFIRSPRKTVAWRMADQPMGS
jgi:hypothetical protein